MVLIGAGMGLTSAPATESIMGVVRPDQADAGSAVNDATREVGGTLGVAVLGGVYASTYIHRLNAHALPLVAPAVVHTARSSLGAGQAAAAQLAGPAQAALHQAVTGGFLSGLHAACLLAAGVCLIGAFTVVALLPRRPGQAVRSEAADANERGAPAVVVRAEG